MIKQAIPMAFYIS